MNSTAKKEVADACRILAATGLAELFTGHVSKRVGDDTVYIPEHLHDEGKGIESVRPNNVIEVDLQGRPVNSDLEPVGEYTIHTSIYRERDEVQSITHSHPLYATALSAAGCEIDLISMAAAVSGSAEVHDPGSQILLFSSEDGDQLAETLGEDDSVLIRGHGAVTTGRTVAESIIRMWYLERAARIQSIASQAGSPNAFPPEARSFMDDSPEDVAFMEAAFEYLRREFLE